jgi:UDP-2,3-diacylglucosamine pyrophosphatase LpxH
MITTVREERMVVVSDVHLGNPLYRARRPFVEFLKFALNHEYSVCLNGDGVDILQTSVGRLTRDLSEAASIFAKFGRRNLRVYYTVGNHDIVLEHFLDDWGIVRCVPFLNVLSGDKRIRVEHGHVYDEMFVRYPRTFEIMTALGGFALGLHPRVFHSFKIFNTALIKAGELRWKFVTKVTDEADALAEQIPGEKGVFLRDAKEISERGFDTVIFGHTHRAGMIELGEGRRYYNTGAWQTNPHFAEIISGEVNLYPVLGAEGAVSGAWSRGRGSWMMQRISD